MLNIQTIMENPFSWIQNEREWKGMIEITNNMIIDLHQHPNPRIVREMLDRYLMQRVNLIQLGMERHYG